MGEGAREVQLQIMSPEDKGERSSDNMNSSFNEKKPTNSSCNKPKSWKWWTRVAIYSFCVVAGQAIATLLGRLYFDKGGSSKWLATLVQLVAFPIIFPLYFLIPNDKKINNNNNQIPISTNDDNNNNNGHIPRSRLAIWYVTFGLIIAGDCYLYSVGLMYLPVSTYSLICASQLAFNALSSFFLNAQKFTPYIVNSLVLLTISSTLLVFQSDSENPQGVSKGKYAIGFICTVGASAGYAFTLSLTQLFFSKVIKKETFRAVLDLIVFQSTVATCVIVIALFGSGEWSGLSKEMGDFKLGKLSYVMTLLGTAISWSAFAVGSVGLISDATSLFSNAISVVGLPVVPVFAVVFFHDKMHGVKVMAMLLAIWGFLSYVYQHYLDDSKLKRVSKARTLGSDEFNTSSNVERS